MEPVQVLAAQLEVQLPGNAPGKAAAGGPGCWTPAPVGALDVVPGALRPLPLK